MASTTPYARRAGHRIRAFLILLAVVVSAAAQAVVPSNSSDLLSEGASTPLVLGATRGQMLFLLSGLIPVGDKALAELPNPNGLTGALRILPSEHVHKLTGNDIAYISCDPPSNGDDVTATELLNSAVTDSFASIILYSTTAHYCEYTPGPQGEQPFRYIYSTTNEDVARDVEGELLRSQGVLPSALIQLRSVIETMNNASANGTGTGTGTGDGDANTNINPGTSSTTAVAMVILYSITGVITVLFLTIIISGAVRAHRYPERYGPNALGRPRQSKAKGIARAMLDTIPIVKFGEHRTKPPDVELAESRAAPSSSAEGVTDRDLPATEGSQSANVPPPVTGGSSDAVSASAPVPAETQPAQDSVPEDNLVCPICTEDFEVGQDIRVLPCDHKYHPACVDPWLLNVSGTCPLCRIDLRRPSQALTADETPATTQPLAEPGTYLTPPETDQEPTTTAPTNDSSRRHSFLAALHLRRMRDAPPAERIAAIRRFHDEQQHSRDASADDAGLDPGRRRRLSARLHDVFGGRARQRESVNSQTGTSAAENAGGDAQGTDPASGPIGHGQNQNQDSTRNVPGSGPSITTTPPTN